TAVMGTAVIGWQKILKKSRMRLILQTAALVILALTVVGRLISGVHWFSDIVAGLLYGLTLVSLYRAWMTEEE
ncbi:MAG TPA: phosphoesterase PA-phosphatase, partial [Lachnospiraceae bacterium]|nr:phosphoesterase PA-phosphatase [Lachnospiraceae bacterium]